MLTCTCTVDVVATTDRLIDPAAQSVHYKLSTKQEAQALNILQNCTHHAALVDIVHTHVLPHLDFVTPKRFLEIGPGMGQVTKELLPKFDATVVVEPNPEVFGLQDPSLRVIRTDFLSAASDADLLQPGSFDLVLCSHVMYHLSQADCQVWVQRMLTLLKPGGKAVIMLAADHGRGYVLHSKVDPTFFVNSGTLKVAIQDLAERFKASGGDGAGDPVRNVPSSFQTLTAGDICHAAAGMQTLPVLNTMHGTEEAMINLLLYFLQYNCLPEALEQFTATQLRQLAKGALEERQHGAWDVWVFEDDEEVLLLSRD